MFSMKAKYAINALVFLARCKDNGYTLAADLAVRESMPRKFLEAILLELKSRGLLQSRKGRGGGYSFVADPRRVSVGQIVEIFDGPLTSPCCVSQSLVRTCEQCDETGCALRSVMDSVRCSVCTILDTTTLALLVTRTAEAQHAKQSPGTYEI